MDVFEEILDVLDTSKISRTLSALLKSEDSLICDRFVVLETVAAAIESEMDSLKPRDHLDSLKPRDHLDSLKPRDHLDRLKPRDHLDRLKPRDHLDRLKPRDHLDRLKLLEALGLVVWERLNTGHWKVVWRGWRVAYGCIAAAKVHLVAAVLLQTKLNKNDEVGVVCRDMVRLCDLGILLGGPVLDHALEKVAKLLTSYLSEMRVEEPEDRLDKRCKIDETEFVLEKVCIKLPDSCPVLDNIAVIDNPDIETFLTKFKCLGRPVIIRGCMEEWPARGGRRAWSTERLVEVAGPRTVPVEVGRDYTHADWTQTLMTVEEFCDKYMREERGEVGYLAQHQLLDQVPQLMEDVIVPDLCYVGEEDEVDVNVWIGPGGTVSPLHTDPKHNFLCQVKGSKYIVLYGPRQNDRLYPHGTDMMKNTSRVNLDKVDLECYPEFAEANGCHLLLRPGEMLYIPPLYWHYVRSLNTSFSVSFWWQ